MFEAYPAERNRPVTRSHPYAKTKEEKEDPPITTDVAVEPTVRMEEIRPTGSTESVQGNVQRIVQPTISTVQPTPIRPKKKMVARKRPLQKPQPSIAAHIQPYNIVADLQQQRANISFGQLFQISPKLRSDVGKSIRKPGTRTTKLAAQFSDQDNPNATALYCDAKVKGQEIPLILDSGAAGSIVSCRLLNDLGIAIDRPSTTLMINVNGERKRPLGEVLNFPITIKGVTIPVDVVVTDAMTYSAIVGNDWLSKVKANIDYETANMLIHWEGKDIEVPIEYLEIPMERRRKQEETNRKGEEEEEDMSEEEEETEEEYEEEDLDEKVFCHFKVKQRPSPRIEQNFSLQLTCRFQEVVIDGIYPKENFVLTKGGVYLDKSFYLWTYFARLNEQFQRKPPKRATWTYDWKGPTARCWCGDRLVSPSDSCSRCYEELTNYITVQRLSPRIVAEISSDFENRNLDPDNLVQDAMPSEVQLEEVVDVANEHDRQLCFYCKKKDPDEWKRQNEVPLHFGHAELTQEWDAKLFELPMGDLTKEQKTNLVDLLQQYRHLFAWDATQLGRTDLVQHTIDVGNATPIKKRWYRTSRMERDFIAGEIDRMLQQNLIEKSRGPWAFPVVLVRKKNGKLRFCVDYRPLNKVTKRDEYPLPRIDDMLDSLGGSAWFTSLDLASGYWQVEMNPKDREKTAFITQFGTFQFTVMPFGLCNAPATFQRLMDEVLHDELWKFVVVYLDDLNIYSRTFDEHLQHLRKIFDRLRDAGLKLNPEKCKFASTELAFLGHVISKDGIRTDPGKISKVKDFPRPTNLTQLRGFLGLASYYRRFIKDFSKIANPLNKLLKKNVPFNWTNAQQQAFEYLKNCLISSPILTYPQWNRPFILFTDASTFALGAVLSQKDEDGNERVVAYASRSLLPAEKNYTATELECLAAVWAIGKFHHYLHGSHFSLITDHSALCHLFNMTTPNGRLARWVMKLQSYDFDTIHRAGKRHSNVDSLSRIR